MRSIEFLRLLGNVDRRFPQARDRLEPSNEDAERFDQDLDRGMAEIARGIARVPRDGISSTVP